MKGAGAKPTIAPKDPGKKRSTKTLGLFLVGGFNPSEKYYSQMGNLPKIMVKIKKSLKPPPSFSPKMNGWNLKKHQPHFLYRQPGE